MRGPSDHLRQVRRVDQKLTRSDGPASALSGCHDCNFFRITVEKARHDAAVVVGGLLLRSINDPIITIRSLPFRFAAFNLLSQPWARQLY